MPFAPVKGSSPGRRVGVVPAPTFPLPGAIATGIGSWPGTDVREALRVVRAELVPALARVLDQPDAEVCGVHTCAGDPPVDLLLEAGARFLAVDLTQLDGSRWEQVAEGVEAGARLWAGLDLGAAEPLAPLLDRWHELGLTRADLGEVGVTPPCGLAGAAPGQTLAATRTVLDLADRLAQTARD